MFVVYLKKFENGKYYIGCTKDFTARMNQHKNRANDEKYQEPVYRAMRLHNHTSEILFECKDEIEMYNKETETIALYKSQGKELYNCTDGGEGTIGYKHTDESKVIMSAKAKERLTMEMRERISVSLGGKLIAKYDLEGNLICIYKSVIYIDTDTRSKKMISSCCNGERNSTRGYIWRYVEDLHTTPDKIEVKLKKRNTGVKAFDLNGNYCGTFKSAVECAKFLGISDSNIGSVLNGKKKNVKGYTFERI